MFDKWFSTQKSNFTNYSTDLSQPTSDKNFRLFPNNIIIPSHCNLSSECSNLKRKYEVAYEHVLQALWLYSGGYRVLVWERLDL